MTTMLSSARSRAGSRSGGVRGPLAAGAEVRLVLPAYRTGERPKGERVPALAVLGRSNVGKSSLLNTLLGTKVARVSQTPGRTQALFWYRVGEKFDVVDCPGYGYAKNSRSAREIFSTLIEELVTGHVGGTSLSAALLLVDGRLEPQDSDLSMALFLRESLVPTVVAATKWDTVKPSERVRRRRKFVLSNWPPTVSSWRIRCRVSPRDARSLRIIRAARSEVATP